jgi:hypothetical protein
MRPPLAGPGAAGIVRRNRPEGADMARTQPTPRIAVDTETGRGWLTYAGILVLIGGVLNVIWGIAAIDKAHFFVANANYVISDLNLWGWVSVVLGAGLIFAGFGIFNRRGWAVWIGIAFASLNAISQMLSIPAYPWWSLALFALDMLAVYGLVAHGLRFND